MSAFLHHQAQKWVRHGDFRADPVKEPGEYLGSARKGQLRVVSPHPYWRLHSRMKIYNDRGAVVAATAALWRAKRSSTALHPVCHRLRDPAQFTEMQWLGIAPSMFQRAGLNADEQKSVLDFLLKNARH